MISSGSCTASHGEVASKGCPDGHRHCRQLIFCLHIKTTVSWQFAAQRFHDARPRFDRVGRAIAHTSGDQAHRHDRVAILGDAVGVFVFAFLKIEGRDVTDRISKTCVISQHGIAQHALVFLAELTTGNADDLVFIEMALRAEQAENEDILSTIPRAAADGLHRSCGEWNADVVNAALVLHFGHLTAVIETDATVTQRADVAIVTVLVIDHQHIAVISRMEHLARAEMKLEDGRSATDRRRDRYVSDHILLRASRARMPTMD